VAGQQWGVRGGGGGRKRDWRRGRSVATQRATLAPAVAMSAPRSRLYRRFVDELEAAHLAAGPDDVTPVTGADVDGLPGVV